MSEPQSRPAPRGRSSARGGRGGSSFGTRGGAAPSPRTRTNGEQAYYEKPPRNSGKAVAEDSETSQLRKKYGSQLSQLKEIFPDWSDEDLLYALEENAGDMENTTVHISEGHTSKWDEVPKKGKERSKSKVKETGSQDYSQSNGRPTRGGRAPFDAGRSTRGARGSDRGGRGGGRGGRGGANGVSRPRTDEPSAATTTGDWVSSTQNAGDWETQENKNVDDSANAGWDTAAPADSSANAGWDAPATTAPSGWGKTAKPAPAAIPAAATKPKAPAAPPAKTWSSLLKAPPAPPAPKKAPTPPKPVLPEPLPEPVKIVEEPEPEVPTAPSEPVEPVTAEPAEPEPTPEPAAPVEEPAAPEPVPEPAVPEPEPVKEEPAEAPQPLTETNLEKVEEAVIPQITETQASTVGSGLTRTTVTPATVAPATPRTKAALVAGLHKGPRTPGFARRTLALEQSEPVVMPSNHNVDRATVQFGSLNLDGAEADVDDEREEPETVQAPQPSPPVQPIASLPASQPAVAAPVAVEQTQPTTIPRQAPGLPPQPQAAALSQSAPQQPSLGPQNFGQQQQQQQATTTTPYNRFGVPEQQKSFEPFAQQQQQVQPQTTQAGQYQQQPPTAQAYGYPTQHQPTSHPGQAVLGGVSSLPDYYNSYAERQPAPGFGYDTSAYQQQLAAQQQQASQHQQDQSNAQRPGLSSAAETASQLSTSAPSQTQNQHLQNRYGIPQVTDVAASGHATPSPGIPTPQQTSQGPQIPAAAQYPLNPSPYYHHPAYATYYMNQYAGYPGYGTPFAAKQGGLYGQPHQAFMSQYTDHTSSPAAVGGFGNPQTQVRDTTGGLGDYGRSGVSQSHPQQQSQQHGNANSFSAPGIPDFLSSRGGLPQQQQLGNSAAGQNQGQQGQGEDSLKPFGENKPPTGPAATPLQGGQPRPASATSGGAALGPQVGLPQGSSGYPTHLNHHLHGQQAHQQQQHQQQQAHQQQQSHYSQQGGYSMYGYPGQYGASNNRTQGAATNSWAGYGH